MSRILLVEDEKVMAKNIAFFLEKEGYQIDIAYDGQTGLDMFQKAAYDLLLLDWTLPRMDGLELCKTVRKLSNVPIMMITAKEEIMDKVVGLEVGADDYVTKPFHQRELLARIHALLRRHQVQPSSASSDNTVEYADLQLDKARLLLNCGGKSTPLTANEYKLLEAMMRHPEHVYSREMLFEQVWGMTSGFSDRTVDVNVSRLRKKITELTGKKYLHAVRGMGYRFGGDG
ncbi:response regulator transcription factor [Paenibacillus sp. J2TS4]|uniref:response regulator transcription factor n=1 Tax=Paenibacillus sp. J2TS4 TaxID=2807194 RepID=UPI001B06086F|nr:response regulator transcription factor [Paenibacillus sp. J2TS4]GIP34345.1 DNA-binding response regulator [Paenibacillus sp. J2TS4]